MGVGDVLDGRFELERVAGQGAMGTVYRAIDRRTGTPVAVKMTHGAFDSAGARRFYREAQVLESLAHEAIVGHIGHGLSSGGALWLAMEWLEGVDLAERLDIGPPPSVEEAVLFAIKTARALGAAHEARVIHRDVKPANIFLVHGDLSQPKVVDFGLARGVDDVRLTQTGVVMGTPSYMAPEQARGVADIDARADIYALGCVLFECLTGAPPFRGEQGLAVLMKTLLEAPPLVNDMRPRDKGVSSELQDLVNRMLEKDPDARPSHGDEVATLLGGITPRTTPFKRRAARRVTATTAITGRERRIASVVAAGGRWLESTQRIDKALEVDPSPTDGTIVDADPWRGVRDAVLGIGARVEVLADGTFVVLVTGAGLPTEHAVQAARHALKIRELRPDVPVVVATGRAMAAGKDLPVGEAIERAVEQLYDQTTHGVTVDALTAGLLPTRFQLTPAGVTGPQLLLAEHEEPPASRALMGQVTPCVGRRRELAQLVTTWSWCTDEPTASAVLVTARFGVGKSRLAREFLEHVQAHEGSTAHVLFGRGDQLAASAYASVAPTVRRWAGLRLGEAGGEARAKLMAALHPIVPGSAEAQRLGWFLGEAINVPWPAAVAGVELEAARSDGTLMADQIKSAFVTWLRLLSAEAPVLLVLDDLHYADVPSLQVVDHCLTELDEHPLMVLGLARPEVHDTHPDLWSERDLTELRLRPMSRKAAEQLARHVLAGDETDALVERIVDQAEGNAFYLEELLRSAVEDDTAQLPDSVLGIVESRVAALDADLRRVLRAASVFGDNFQLEGVAELLGQDPGDGVVRDNLGFLTRREVIVSQGPITSGGGDGRFRFRSGLVREAVYAMLTDEDRLLGHRMAGSWLERIGDGDPLALAEHYDRGGAPRQAAQWFISAARRELASNDFEGALLCTRRALAASPDTSNTGRIRELEAEAFAFNGKLDLCVQSAEAAVTHGEPGSDSWFRAMGYLVWSCSLLGREESLEAALAELDRVPVAADAVGTVAPVIAYCQAAYARQVRGAYSESERFLAEAEAASQAIDDVGLLPLARGRLSGLRARVALTNGDFSSAMTAYVDAVAAYDACGYARRACGGRTSLGFAAMQVGRWEEARVELEAAVSEAERMGMAHVASTARQNLGLTLARLGQMDRARAVERKAVESLAQDGDVRMLGSARCYLSQILRLSGELEGAETEARAALELLDAFPPSRVTAAAALATVLLDRGRHDEALEHTRRGMGELLSLRQVDEGEMQLRLVHAEALRAAGDLKGASVTLRDARARLRSRAQRISDEGYRGSFLHDVPENARIMSLAEASD